MRRAEEYDDGYYGDDVVPTWPSRFADDDTYTTAGSTEENTTWFDDLGYAGQTLLLSFTGLLLFVLVVVFTKTVMASKKMPITTADREGAMQRRKQTDSLAAAVGEKRMYTQKMEQSQTMTSAMGGDYVMKSSVENPLRSPEFKPIMDMLKANGEFDDELAEEEIFYVALRDVAAIPSEQLVACRQGDIIMQLDTEGEWIWGMLKAKEGWFDPLNVRKLSPKEVEDYKKAKVARKAARSAKRAQAPLRTTAFPAGGGRPLGAQPTAISMAAGSVLNSPRQGDIDRGLSRLLTSPPSEADSMAWDPKAVVSPEELHAEQEMTGRPDPFASVSAQISGLKAEQKKALAIGNRKEHIDQSKAASAAATIAPAPSLSPIKPTLDDTGVTLPSDALPPSPKADFDLVLGDDEDALDGAVGDALDAAAAAAAAAAEVTGMPSPTKATTRPASGAQPQTREQAAATKAMTIKNVKGKGKADQNPGIVASPIDPQVAKNFYDMFS